MPLEITWYMEIAKTLGQYILLIKLPFIKPLYFKKNSPPFYETLKKTNLVFELHSTMTLVLHYKIA